MALHETMRVFQEPFQFIQGTLVLIDVSRAIW